MSIFTSVSLLSTKIECFISFSYLLFQLITQPVKVIISSFTLNTYILFLSVKQGGIMYNF